VALNIPPVVCISCEDLSSIELDLITRVAMKHGRDISDWDWFSLLVVHEIPD
jgi:hypothetical protein